MGAPLRWMAALFFLMTMSGCLYFSSDPTDNVVAYSAVGVGFDVPVGTTMAVVFVANQTSGPHPATEAHSLDESIVKVVPSTIERPTEGEGLDNDPGKIFLIYGVSPGEAMIEVFRDGEDVGPWPIVIVGQDRT